jgi:hypothetical protein
MLRKELNFICQGQEGSQKARGEKGRARKAETTAKPAAKKAETKPAANKVEANQQPQRKIMTRRSQLPSRRKQKKFKTHFNA